VKYTDYKVSAKSRDRPKVTPKVICAKNYENILKFVTVMHSKP